MPGDPVPARLLLQWHLSDVCNLRCTHCYQSAFASHPFGLSEWLHLLDDYIAFLQGDGRQPPRRGHINLTGGEPLALRELPALLDAFVLHRQQFSFAILSNGTLVDPDMAARLRCWGPKFVQVSIDGNPATHDRIRGKGSHAKAVAGIRALRAEGIPVLIAFTAQPGNYREFADVARLGRELGVRRVWTDRVIPPPGPLAAGQSLSREQTVEYLQIIARARMEGGRRSQTEIAAQRALQFLEGGSAIYRCTAGESLITVMPDGTLYPCRRLPIPAGNVYQTSLQQIYDSDAMLAVRAPREFHGCEQCGFAPLCRGGLRCLAWAVHGRLDQADPGCPLAHSSGDQGAVFPGIVPVRSV